MRCPHRIQTPVVSVSVETSRPMRVAITGEVVRDGVYQLDSGSGVLEALAAAGGVNEYAGGRIMVVRHRPELRVKMTYSHLVSGRGRGLSFPLRDGDAVIVE